MLVEGEVDAQGFTDKQGNVRASLELTATAVKFLGGRGEVTEGIPGTPAEAPPETEDEIPF